MCRAAASTSPGWGSAIRTRRRRTCRFNTACGSTAITTSTGPRSTPRSSSSSAPPTTTHPITSSRARGWDSRTPTGPHRRSRDLPARFAGRARWCAAASACSRIIPRRRCSAVRWRRPGWRTHCSRSPARVQPCRRPTGKGTWLTRRPYRRSAPTDRRGRCSRTAHRTSCSRRRTTVRRAASVATCSGAVPCSTTGSARRCPARTR